MNLFSILSGLAPLAGVATGNPFLGLAGGSLFGALGGNQEQEERERQRKKELGAKAMIEGSSWARRGASPQVEVSRWRPEGELATQGLFSALSTGLKNQDLFDELKKGTNATVKSSNKPVTLYSNDLNPSVASSNVDDFRVNSGFGMNESGMSPSDPFDLGKGRVTSDIDQQKLFQLLARMGRA